MTLADYQFELGGVPFGIGADISVDSFDPGSGEWVVQDSQNPRQSGRHFGRDVLHGGSWTWTMFTDQDRPETALAALEGLATAWRVGATLPPGHGVPLTYRIAGRERRVYGRPRRWSAPPNNLILGGLIPITADFQLVDPYHYDEIEENVVVGLTPLSQGGIVFPTVFPASTLPPGNRAGSFFVAGSAETHPTVRIDGPITDPWVRCGADWLLEMVGTIPAEKNATVDTRSWGLGITGSAVMLGRRQWLEDIVLRPGGREITFGGTGGTGGALCTVSWRGAWNSL